MMGVTLFHHSTVSHVASCKHAVQCPPCTQPVWCRASPASPGATNSPPHSVAHTQSATPAASNQPAGRLASLSLGASQRPYILGSCQEARRGSFTSMSTLPGLCQGRMRHAWPRAAQGASTADCCAGEAGEQSGQDADAMCGPAWERGVARSRRAGSSDSGHGLRPGETWAERSCSMAAPQAQCSPNPERSHSHSGGSRRSSSPAVSPSVCHGRPVTSHATSSHGHSGSQRSHGHRRRRCGPGRRALGAIMRMQRRFIGGWRHPRHRRGSRSRGRSSSIVLAASASADGGATPRQSEALALLRSSLASTSDPTSLT